MNKTNLIFTISLSIIGLAILGFVINAVIQKGTVYTPSDPQGNRNIICRDIDENNPEPLFAPSHVKIYETITEHNSGMTYLVFPDQCVINNPSLIDETICEYMYDQGNKVTPRASYIRTECPRGYVCEPKLPILYSIEEEARIKENIRRDIESNIKEELRNNIKRYNPGFTATQVDNEVYSEFNSEEEQERFKELLDLKFKLYFSAAACIKQESKANKSSDTTRPPTYYKNRKTSSNPQQGGEEDELAYGTGPTVDEAKRIFPLS